MEAERAIGAPESVAATRARYKRYSHAARIDMQVARAIADSNSKNFELELPARVIAAFDSLNEEADSNSEISEIESISTNVEVELPDRAIAACSTFVEQLP